MHHVGREDHVDAGVWDAVAVLDARGAEAEAVGAEAGEGEGDVLGRNVRDDDMGELRAEGVGVGPVAGADVVDGVELTVVGAVVAEEAVEKGGGGGGAAFEVVVPEGGALGEDAVLWVVGRGGGDGHVGEMERE